MKQILTTIVFVIALLISNSCTASHVESTYNDTIQSKQSTTSIKKGDNIIILHTKANAESNYNLLGRHLIQKGYFLAEKDREFLTMTTKPKAYTSGGGAFEYILQMAFLDSSVFVVPRYVNLMSFGAFMLGDVETTEGEWSYDPSAMKISRNAYRDFIPILESFSDSITYEKR